MHDHSRFQRDIEWRHRRLSLSLSLLLTKVTHAQYRKRFRVSYNLTNLVNLKATDLEKHYSARIPKTQYCVRFPEFIRKVKSLLVQVVSDPLHKLLAWHVLFCEPPKVYPVLHSKVVMFWYTGLGACAIIFPLSGGGSAVQVATVNTSSKEEQTLLYILITSFRYWKEMCSPIVFNLAFFFTFEMSLAILIVLLCVVQNTAHLSLCSFQLTCGSIFTFVLSNNSIWKTSACKASISSAQHTTSSERRTPEHQLGNAQPTS